MNDRDFVTEAIEMAAEGVLFDPTDDEIVLAVEECVGRTVPVRWASRIVPAILSGYNRADRVVNDPADAAVLGEAEKTAIERSVASTYGL